MNETVETCGKAYCEHYPDGLFVCAKCRDASSFAHDKACAKIADALAEIERKDELIEQMRTTLIAARNGLLIACDDNENDSRVKRFFDYIDSALAAERGGK